MPDRPRWRADSAWAGVCRPQQSENADLSLAFVDPACLATIIVRRGHEAALERLLHEQFGCIVPAAGRVTRGRTGHLIWTAPGQWLAMSMTDHGFFDLSARLTGVAAVIDQSDSRALLEIAGPRARDTLAKGFAIDLHPSVFSIGSTAITKVAHLSVQIWQVDEAPTFAIAIPRSFAGTFGSWLSSACAPDLASS